MTKIILSEKLSNIYSDGIVSGVIFAFLLYDILLLRDAILGVGAFLSILYSGYRAAQNEVSTVSDIIIIKNIVGKSVIYNTNDFRYIKIKSFFPIAEIYFVDNRSHSFFITNRYKKSSKHFLEEYNSYFNKLKSH